MLGFVLPATLYLKTHEGKLRLATLRGHALLAELFYGTGATTDGSGREEGMTRGREEGRNANGSYRRVHSAMGSSSSHSMGRDARVEDEEGNGEETDQEVTVTFQRGSSAPSSGEDDIEFGYADDSSSSAQNQRIQRRSSTAVLAELHALFSPFYLSFTLVVFGFAALIIGVTTVLMDAT